MPVMAEPRRYRARNAPGHKGFESTQLRGELPDKESGRHRWIVIVTHTITSSQAAAADAGSKITLDAASCIGLHVGCLDCEGVYEQVRLERCEAAPFDWHKT